MSEQAQAPFTPAANSDDHVKAQLVRNNRLLGGFATMLFAYSAIATSALIYLIINQQVEVVFVNFEPETAQLVHLKRDKISTTANELLTEKYLRAYVTNREKIDHVTFEGRSNFVRVFTDKAWFQAWAAYMNPRSQKSPRNVYRQANMTREVEVISFVKFPLQKNTYQIEFVSIDRQDRTEVKRENWVATIVAVQRDLQGTADDISLNPLGLTITSYTIAKKGTVQ